MRHVLAFDLNDITDFSILETTQYRRYNIQMKYKQLL